MKSLAYQYLGYLALMFVAVSIFLLCFADASAPIQQLGIHDPLVRIETNDGVYYIRRDYIQAFQVDRDGFCHIAVQDGALSMDRELFGTPVFQNVGEITFQVVFPEMKPQ